MSGDNLAIELLRLEDPIQNAVGLSRALHLTADGLDDDYDRTALKAVCEALEAELEQIEKTWTEIHKMAQNAEASKVDEEVSHQHAGAGRAGARLAFSINEVVTAL